jgi:hypothetical protein
VRRLERGDRIISEHEATLAVADVSLEERSTLVYNFEVAQDHNYFVGDEGAEAHNARKLGPSGKPLLHFPFFKSRKDAYDAARQGGQGKPVHHPNPTNGCSHFHATDDNGEIIKDGIHYGYGK